MQYRRPSLCRQLGFRNFLMFLASFLALWWPNTCPKNGVFGTFLKKLLAQFISFLAFTLMGWVSWPLYIFVFLASFSALRWPNIWPKMGSPELFGKTIGSIHFVPGIYPYGVSLLTHIHFGVSSLIFGPLVAKYLAENGVSGTFWKNYWLNSLHSWPLTLMGWVSWPLYIFVFLASFSALWWPNIWPKITAWRIFSIRSFVELSRPLVVHCCGHYLPHMGLPMGQKLVKFATNWVQTLRIAYLWNRWIIMDVPHLKFHGLVWTCSCELS